MPSPQEFIVAFAAGAVTFASPCMLPLVPGFAAWSASANETTATPDRPARSASMRLAAWFVVGFGLVFVALGTLSGAAGSVLQQVRGPAQIVGGVLIALFGLFMLADRWLPVRFQQRLGARERRFAATPSGAVAFGAVFGAAWSPCIGPTLGAILTLAAGTGGAVEGAALLTVFTLGLGLPFLLLASGIGRVGEVLPVLRRRTNAIRVASGVVLVAFGVLLATGVLADLSAQLSGIPGIEL